MEITDKFKQRIKKGLVSVLVLGNIFIATYTPLEINHYHARFQAEVYRSAETDEEKLQKEREFFEKTGLKVEEMSILDKYFYGKALSKGYIK